MEKFDSQVDLAKVDVDVLPNLALSYDVTSVPSVHVFVHGDRKTGFVGLKDKEFLTDFVKNIVMKN